MICLRCEKTLRGGFITICNGFIFLFFIPSEWFIHSFMLFRSTGSGSLHSSHSKHIHMNKCTHPHTHSQNLRSLNQQCPSVYRFVLLSVCGRLSYLVLVLEQVRKHVVGVENPPVSILHMMCTHQKLPILSGTMARVSKAS